MHGDAMVSDMVAISSSDLTNLFQLQATPAYDMINLPKVSAQPHSLGHKVTREIVLAPFNEPWRVRYVKGCTARNADLDKRLSALDNDIDQTSIEPPPPFEPVQAALPELRYHSFDAYANVPTEHKAEHSNLYHLVMPTIDLGGIQHDGNMEVTAPHFHDGHCHDGRGFFEWCGILPDACENSSQYDLQVKLAATNIQAMELAAHYYQPKWTIRAEAVFSQLFDTELARTMIADCSPLLS
jgi:hypothetical protein